MEQIKASLRIGYGNRVVSLLLTSIFVLFFIISAVYTYTRVSTPARAYAATSSNLNFQARLLGNTGSSVPDGLYNVEFNLYTVSSGGATEWTETRTGANKVRVANGYLSVALGDVTAFPGTINWDQDHWLTMNIGGTGAPSWDGEMNPRLKLTAVPYAFQAKQAEKLLKLDGANTGILDFLALTANRTINLPDQGGTLCIQGSANCVDVATTNDTATTSSNSGLEISSDGLRLLGGCADSQLLRWNETAKVWECGSSGSSVTVRESDGSPSTSATTLEFGPASNSDDEFIITAEGGGITRIRLGDTVLTTTNYSTTLDGTYVNVGESPASGDISGSFMGGFTLGANTVDLGTDTVGNYVATIGTVTGLTLSNNTGEGSTPGLSVNYGALANTAVQGNTQLTCASGAGDLSGGGTVITLGSGGTCANLTISESPVFSTSVTTPLLESASGLTLNTIASGGADDIILQTAGTEKMRLLENGDIRFEKGTDDVTFTIASPSGAPAIYTFSGATGTVLTTANYTTNLDATYVNVGESPAAGDITGSFSGGFTIGTNTVALGTDTVGDYVANLGTVAGLSLSGNSGEGSTPGLSVLYGSTASTAVQGNTQLTCALGTGNLTGGGTVVTLGSGGTCAGISTNDAVTFAVSVTTSLVTNNGGLTVSTTGGGNALSLNSGSGTINVGAGTVATTAGLTFDTVNASNTTFVISNTGEGVAHLNLADGGLQLAGTSVLSNGRALSNITGLSSSGTVTLSSLNGGGMVKAAATSGDLSLAVAGTDYESPLTFNNGLTRTSNTVKLGGNLTGATSIGLNSNTLSITGSGTAAINAASGGGLEILSDTTAALAVRNSAGSVTYFNVDVSGKIVQIGSSTANANATLLILNSYNGASDPTGVNGASYYSTVQKRMRCYEDGRWENCVSDAVERKTANQTVTNSAAFANDTDLKFPMDANSTYTFNAVINFSSTSAIADFKYTFTVPAGASVYITAQAPTGAAAITPCVITASGQTCTLASTANFRSSMMVSGYITTAGTAGDLQYQFAQNTATIGQSVTTYIGSSISWRRTAP